MRAALNVLREVRLLEGDAQAELTVLSGASSSSVAPSTSTRSGNGDRSSSSSGYSGDLLAGLLLQPGSTSSSSEGDSSRSGLWWVLPLVVDRSAIPSSSSHVATNVLETAAAASAAAVASTDAAASGKMPSSSSVSSAVVVGELRLQPMDRRACPPWFRPSADDSKDGGDSIGSNCSGGGTGRGEGAIRLRVSVDGAGAVTLEVFLDPALKKMMKKKIKGSQATLPADASLKQHAVCAALAQGTARVVKQEMRVLAARERQQSNYQVRHCTIC